MVQQHIMKNTLAIFITLLTLSARAVIYTVDVSTLSSQSVTNTGYLTITNAGITNALYSSHVTNRNQGDSPFMAFNKVNSNFTYLASQVASNMSGVTNLTLNGVVGGLSGNNLFTTAGTNAILSMLGGGSWTNGLGNFITMTNGKGNDLTITNSFTLVSTNQSVVSAIYDSTSNQFYVIGNSNVVGGSSWLYFTGNKISTNGAQISLIPIMTSNTHPYGVASSDYSSGASLANSEFEPYLAFALTNCCYYQNPQSDVYHAVWGGTASVGSTNFSGWFQYAFTNTVSFSSFSMNYFYSTFPGTNRVDIQSSLDGLNFSTIFSTNFFTTNLNWSFGGYYITNMTGSFNSASANYLRILVTDSSTNPIRAASSFIHMFSVYGGSPYGYNWSTYTNGNWSFYSATNVSFDPITGAPLIVGTSTNYANIYGVSYPPNNLTNTGSDGHTYVFTVTNGSGSPYGINQQIVFGITNYNILTLNGVPITAGGVQITDVVGDITNGISGGTIHVATNSSIYTFNNTNATAGTIFTNGSQVSVGTNCVSAWTSTKTNYNYTFGTNYTYTVLATMGSLTSAMTADYEFESNLLNSISAAYAVSNNPYVYNGVYNYSGSYYGGGVSGSCINGSTNEITLAESVPTTNKTISLWFNYMALLSGFHNYYPAYSNNLFYCSNGPTITLSNYSTFNFGTFGQQVSDISSVILNVNGYSKNIITTNFTGSGYPYAFSDGICDGYWHHVAVVCSNNLWSGYFDGTNTFSNYSAGANASTNLPTISGAIDQINIWSNSLTSAQVLSAYNAALSGSAIGTNIYHTGTNITYGIITNTGVLNLGSAAFTSSTWSINGISNAPVIISGIGGTVILNSGNTIYSWSPTNLSSFNNDLTNTGGTTYTNGPGAAGVISGSQIGTNLTAYALQSSLISTSSIFASMIGVLGVNDTNFALGIGANDTNFALGIGLAATNLSITVSTNFAKGLTNSLLATNGSGQFLTGITASQIGGGVVTNGDYASVGSTVFVANDVSSYSYIQATIGNITLTDGAGSTLSLYQGSESMVKPSGNVYLNLVSGQGSFSKAVTIGAGIPFVSSWDAIITNGTFYGNGSGLTNLPTGASITNVVAGPGIVATNINGTLYITNTSSGGGSAWGFYTNIAIPPVSTATNIPHGLGATPTRYVVRMVMTNAVKGVSTGYKLNQEITDSSLNGGNFTYRHFVDPTNVIISTGSSGIYVYLPAGGAATPITNADWNIRIYASP